MTRQVRPRRYLGAGGLMGVLVSLLVATGASADDDFVTGSGRARASLFEIVPRTGGLTLPVNLGRALTTYQGTVATASSTAVKPPSEPAADCANPSPGAGAARPRRAADSPAPPGTEFPFASTLEVTSDAQGAEAGRRADLAATPPESPVQGALQHQEVAATRRPFGRASTISGRLAFAGLAELTGGQAAARTGLVDGPARVAEAVVTLQRLALLDGLVALENLRWEAVQRTGTGETADGSFTIGRVLLSGQALPAPPAGSDPLAPVNQALAPTGLALDPPRFDRSEGVARVTPLSLRLADSAVGRQAVGPVVAALQPVRDPLVQGLLGISCDFGLAVTVADVAAGILSGSGGVSFDVGGVAATTEGVRYDNPLAGAFGDEFPGFEPVPAGEGSAAGAAAPAFPYPGLAPGDVTPSPSVPFDDPGMEDERPSSEAGRSDEAAGAAPGPSAAQPASAGPVSSRLPGRRGGAALLVALIGLAGIAVLAAADGLHLRRAARSLP